MGIAGLLQPLFIPQAACPELKPYGLVKSAGFLILTIHRQLNPSKILALQIGEPNEQKLPTQTSASVIWIHTHHVDATGPLVGSVVPEVYPRPTIANGFIRIEGQNDVPRGTIGKIDADPNLFNRVGIVSPAAGEGTVLNVGQSCLFAGLHETASKGTLAAF